VKPRHLPERLNGVPHQLFPVTTVGSWPRPKALLAALRARQQNRIEACEFSRAADDAIREFVELQERVGIDVLTDGELRRDSFYSFVGEKFGGVRVMTLAEMLDHVEDKAAFERLLQTLDVPAYSIRNPTCVGRLTRRESLAGGDLEFLRRWTDRPIKITLPGPYLLTRAMFVPELTRAAYATKEELAEDVVRLLRAEIEELVNLGADFIQLDEPVLSELVFGQGQTRTFMCAALAAHKDPRQELEFAVSLINRVVADVEGTRLGVHVCRGNWSRNESTLLEGGYHPLVPYLRRLHVQQLVLEYATERAGDLVAIEGRELGLGVVNPRTDRVESPEEIEGAVGRALAHYRAEEIFLNPDCGFGTFAGRPMNVAEVAEAKLRAMVEAARRLRARHT
jgi:5-methyltetrahydropteroyltriglutamate--homocysteine methyltransferase